MLKEGDVIYFEEAGHIYSGHVINLTKDTFQIDSYGSCCEGHCTIGRDQIGIRFFTTKEELQRLFEIND